MVTVREGDHLRFRCHTGHAFSTEVLRGELRDAAEEALWSAARAFEEYVMVLEHHAAGLSSASDTAASEAAYREARIAAERARHVRDLTVARPG